MLNTPMPHVSLYRKYRSQRFADVVGQNHVTKTLENAAAEDRIAHAYLFSGPRGTGKTSTARILAKALNCEKGGREPCNECPSCLAITEGNSLDVVEIDAASHGSVEDARDIKQRVTTAPVAAKWKVFIIDECHMLSPAANNALLKVLEEPPAHVVFVFATTESHKVLQTLLDRCQRYEFRAIAVADVAERLAYVCEAEGFAIDEDALNLIAARAGGSLRDALSLLDQLTAYAGSKVTVEDVSHLMGSLPDEIFFEVIDIIAGRDIGQTFLFADRLVRSGADLREFVRALVDHLRSIFLVLNATAPHEVLDVTDEFLERIRAEANRFDSAEVLRLIDLANEVQLQLRQASEGRLALEVGLAKMTRPDLHATPANLLARLERLERVAGLDPVDAEEVAVSRSKPAAAMRASVSATSAQRPVDRQATEAQSSAKSESPPSAQPAKPEPKIQAATQQSSPLANAEAADVVIVDVEEALPHVAGEVTIDHIKRAWPLVLEKVKRRKISFGAMLLPAEPVAYKGNELVLAFGPKSNFHKDNVSKPEQQVFLVEALDEAFGIKPKIRCVTGADTSAPPPKSQIPASTQLREEIKGSTDADPSVAEPAAKGSEAVDLIIEAFGAEVVDE
ncbi:MAG: DNA polymerase III subunit gamma/tau [Actinobacteria bacterium]|nr:DNA polymerase III subunit gamma/tau [Actinomycetota bacterium]